MKVVRCHHYGTPDVLRIDDVPPRDPGSGEVRVRWRWLVVNFCDAVSWVSSGSGDCTSSHRAGLAEFNAGIRLTV